MGEVATARVQTHGDWLSIHRLSTVVKWQGQEAGRLPGSDRPQSPAVCHGHSKWGPESRSCYSHAGLHGKASYLPALRKIGGLFRFRWAQVSKQHPLT